MIIYVFFSVDMVFEDDPPNFQGKNKSSVNIWLYDHINYINIIIYIYIYMFITFHNEDPVFMGFFGPKKKSILPVFGPEVGRGPEPRREPGRRVGDLGKIGKS